jgi:hypothetical protein
MTALQLVTGNRDWAEVVPSLPSVHERRLLILSEPADRSLYPPHQKMCGWFGHLFTAVNFRDADFIGHLDAPTKQWRGCGEQQQRDDGRRSTSPGCRG